MNNINGVKSANSYHSPVIKTTNQESGQPASLTDKVELSDARSTKSKKSGGTILEEYIQKGTDKICSNLFSKPQNAKLAGQIIGAVPAGAARYVGTTADMIFDNADRIAANTKTRIDNVKDIIHKGSDSSFKTGLSVAGSVIGGVVGAAIDTAAAVFEIKYVIDDAVEDIVVNSVDNLEGTKRKELAPSKSSALKADVAVEKFVNNLKKDNGPVAGTALGVLGAAGGAVVETAATLADTGKLVYARMNDRAVKDGVGYKYEKKQAYAEYEASDKKIKDKFHLVKTRLVHNFAKIGDLRAGDLLRVAQNVMNLPAFLVTNALKNLGDVFK